MDLKQKSIELGLPSIQKHIFICADQTKPQCCSYDEGIEAWNYLKKRIKELKLDQVGIYRSKVNCLRVCMKGPIVVIYPDSIWYHSCTLEVLELILQKHIIGGQPVQEFIFVSQ